MNVEKECGDKMEEEPEKKRRKTFVSLVNTGGVVRHVSVQAPPSSVPAQVARHVSVQAPPSSVPAQEAQPRTSSALHGTASTGGVVRYVSVQAPPSSVPAQVARHLSVQAPPSSVPAHVAQPGASSAPHGTAGTGRVVRQIDIKLLRSSLRADLITVASGSHAPKAAAVCAPSGPAGSSVSLQQSVNPVNAGMATGHGQRDSSGSKKKKKKKERKKRRKSETMPQLPVVVGPNSGPGRTSSQSIHSEPIQRDSSGSKKKKKKKEKRKRRKSETMPQLPVPNSGPGRTSSQSIHSEPTDVFVTSSAAHSYPGHVPGQQVTRPSTVQNIPQQTPMVLNSSSVLAPIPSQSTSLTPYPIFGDTYPQAINLDAATNSVPVCVGYPETAENGILQQSSVNELKNFIGEINKFAQDKTAKKRDNSKWKSRSLKTAIKDKASQKGGTSGRKTVRQEIENQRPAGHQAMKRNKVPNSTLKRVLARVKCSSSGHKSAREDRAGVKSKTAGSAAEQIWEVPSQSAVTDPGQMDPSQASCASGSGNQASNTEAPPVKPRAKYVGKPGMSNDELFNDTFFSYLWNGNYMRFLKRLYYNRKGHRKAAQQLVVKDMVAELRHMVDRKTPSVWTSKKKKFDSARTFSWEAAERQAEQRCPLLYAVLDGAMGKKKTRKHVREERKDSVYIAVIFGLLDRMCRVKYFNVLQEIVSLELYLGGCSRKVMNRLSELGLCLHPATLQTLVTQILRRNKIDIHAKIQQVETVCSRTQEEPQQVPQEEPQKENKVAQRIPAGTRTSTRIQHKEEARMRKLDSEEKVATTDSSKEGDLKKDVEICQSVDIITSERRMIDDKNLGYSLSFGDIPAQAMFFITGQSKAMPEKRGTMVHTFLAVDRIPSMHLGEEVLPPEELRIRPEKFVSGYYDRQRIQLEYVAMVERILVKRLPCFQRCAGEVDYHITHKYSEESNKKSRVIPLGMTHTLNEVSKCEEMADVLDALHKQHVPVAEQTGPVRTILGCKPAMSKIVTEAQKARGTGEEKCDRLEGLYLPPQEWQKHGAYIQETYRQLYDLRSSNDRGTLSNIRDWYPDNTFTDIRLETTDHAATLLRFATEAYVVAAACSILSFDDHPGTFKLKGGPGEKRKKLQRVAESVVKMAFQHSTVEAKPSKVKVKTESPEEGLYCICRKDEDELMVQCDNGSCKRGSWFHLSCLDLDSDDLPVGDWFCSSECEAETQCDYVHEYSRALLYRGLGEMVRNDAMCENDGFRMCTHWKYDMVDFFRGQQTEMFEEGFAYLSATMGVASPRVAHQLQWNRTVNVSGEAGGNMPLDRYMEMMDAEFEDAMRSAGIIHLYPSKGVRISQLLALRRDIEDNLDQSVVFDSEESERKEEEKNQDILELAKRLMDHRCLDVIPGRSHEGFPKFTSRTHLDAIDDYIEELTKRCEEWKRDNVPAEMVT